MLNLLLTIITDSIPAICIATLMHLRYQNILWHYVHNELHILQHAIAGVTIDIVLIGAGLFIFANLDYLSSGFLVLTVTRYVARSLD